MKIHRDLDEQKLVDMIAHLLRAGVVVAALIVIGGGIPYLASKAWARAGYHTFHGEPSR